ncbi:MAG: restriction endonuclease subunit S, partial [Endomicrobiia bacterium]|nr:restriction endonuclease subunit S [Endomicrobiia bacterium]
MGQKFKKTPAGEIPVDWGVTTFGESFDFLRTANNSRDDLNSSGEIGYLHYGDIHTKWQTKLQCDRIELPKIAAAKVEGIPLLKNGDLAMADASEDYAGVGVSVEVVNVGNQRIVGGLHTILLRDKGNRFADGFRGYLQYVPIVHQSLVKIATGGSVYGVSKGNLSGVSIPCPPLHEQKKISIILSEIDALIDNVSTEIEKTKELKKGLMRQLLTRGIGHKKFKKTEI